MTAVATGRWSFKTKLQLLCAGLVLSASAIVALSMYTQASQAIHERESVALKAEVAHYTEMLGAPFRLMEQDASLFAQFGVVSTLIKGVNAGANTGRLEAQIAGGFSSLLRARPHYFQARVIGLADNGREIVRVNKVDDQIVYTSPTEMQQKGDEPYMRQLADSKGAFFSAVTLNRENGVVDPRRLPTIRLVQPIVDDNGVTIGAIVLNVDYRALLQKPNFQMLKGHTLTVINAEGDHFEAASGTGEGVLSLHDDPGFVPSPYHGAWRDGESSVIIRDSEEAYRKTLSLGAPGHGQYLDVIVSVPIRALHEPGVVALRNALLLAGGFLVLTLLVAWIVGDRIARPLVDLAHAIASRERVLKPLELCHQGHGGTDEVGLLAHAFNGLTSQLIAQTAETVAIVSAAPDGIATFDAHGKILKCNRAFEDLFGAGHGALNGANLRGLLCDGDALGALIPQAGAAAESDARALYSLEGCRLDGTTFPAEMALNAVSDERETRFVAMLRDVTERREAERQLRQTVETLEATKVELVRSNEELDTFAYIASHDLRAPLRVIRNASRWLEDDLGDALDEESQENLGLLRSRVNRMDQLLTDLLEHSRVGRVQHDGSTVTGADLVENIRHLVNAPEGFTITASPELEAMEVRQLPLQTVLLNLVSNALKHHDKAFGHVMIDVTRTEDGVLRFDVTDDGPGIAVEYQTRIFDMFQTLKSRDEVEGSGIGLAIVKKTVEMSGGLVSVDSTPGEGCSFSFTWPDDCGKGEAKGKGTSDDRTAAA